MRRSRAVRFPGLFAVTALCLLSLARPGGTAEPQGGPPAAPAPAYVKLREHRLFAIRVSRGSKTAEDRARDASQALASVMDSPGPKLVHVEEDAEGGAILFVDSAPIVQLGPEDAAATGDDSLHVHAAFAKARVEQALHAEVRRQALSDIVLQVSLAVFAGLLAFLAIRKLGDLELAVERWLDARPQGAPAVRLGNVELASERAVRGGLHVVLRFSKRAFQVLVAYLWFLLVLSLFPITSGVGDRITRMMLAPVGRVLARGVSAVPQLLAVAVLGLLLFLVLRSVQLFFGSVARGETHVAWIPADLARPTSTLLQAVLLILAVVFAGPIISGGGAGPFQGLAQAMLIGLAIACAPLFAAVVAGLPVVYGRGLRVGDVAEVGGQIGMVKEVDLLSVVLEDAGGRPVRVPHLVSLFQPTRVIGPATLSTLDVTVGGAEDQARVMALLVEAAGSHASGARVELRSLDANGALYRITSGYDDVGLRIAGALKDAGVALASLGEAGASR
jgi:small-conductance mechanosensitive channel